MHYKTTDHAERTYFNDMNVHDLQVHDRVVINTTCIGQNISTAEGLQACKEHVAVTGTAVCGVDPYRPVAIFTDLYRSATWLYQALTPVTECYRNHSTSLHKSTSFYRSVTDLVHEVLRSVTGTDTGHCL